jgi:hypothetical protein
MENNRSRERAANLSNQKNPNHQNQTPNHPNGFEGMNFEQQRDSYRGNNRSVKGGKQDDDTGGGNNSGKRQDNN